MPISTVQRVLVERFNEHTTSPGVESQTALYCANSAFMLL